MATDLNQRQLAKFLHEAAQGAGDILKQRFAKVHQVERKRGAGIVTEADRLAESFILKKISRFYPNSSILTEESGEFKRHGELLFVIDPLDGTTNYAHGFPVFAVSIGLYIEDQPFAGIVYNPVQQELFFAQKGKGTHLNGKRVRVSKTTQLKDSLLGTGFYYARGKQLNREIEIFRRMNEVALGVRRPGAAALDLAYVACGRYDGFWERKLSAWDVAAGFLLVTEAGGKVSDYQGAPMDIFHGECLASNTKLHRKMVNVLTGRRKA